MHKFPFNNYKIRLTTNTNNKKRMIFLLVIYMFNGFKLFLNLKMKSLFTDSTT